MQQLTRLEIERKLEAKYKGAVISLEMPWMRYPEPGENFADQRPAYRIEGKIMQLAVETTSGEPMVVFTINHVQYKADVNYFIENTTIHGNPHRTGAGSSGVQEGD